MAVSVRNPRAMASLEPGAITWATSIAHHQIPLPRRHRVEQFVDAQRPRGAQHRRDMPVRQAAGDLERLATDPPSAADP